MIVRKGMEMAGKDVPLKKVVIGRWNHPGRVAKPAPPTLPVIEAVKA
jgi:hypothetical protein